VALEGKKGRTVDLTPPAAEAIAESFGEWVINGVSSCWRNSVSKMVIKSAAAWTRRKAVRTRRIIFFQRASSAISSESPSG
jgi:hypothetical protein